MSKPKCPRCRDNGILLTGPEKYCTCPAAAEYKAAMAKAHETLGRVVIPPAPPETLH